MNVMPMPIGQPQFFIRPLTQLAVVALACIFSSTARAVDYPNIVDDPPRSPAEEQKAFHLPPGFEIQLVAAEPEVHKPMNFNFDAAGRLWFTGSVEYPYPVPDTVKGRDTLRI